MDLRLQLQLEKGQSGRHLQNIYILEIPVSDRAVISDPVALEFEIHHYCSNRQ